ncbi:MAG: nickel-dependent lactate racemase [Deltaproteobacteria bacterium]|jgi:hypothetical protein|nr:nickel-dependent lactate racemase [Deltaproteobacteria bacterium]
MSIIADLLSDTAIPEFFPVRQTFPEDALDDLPAAVAAALSASGIQDLAPSGGEVAIGVGSRGIAGLPALVRSTVRWFAEKGCRPFIVPAMGSHGGATGPGQAAMLAELGVTEQSAGCEIRASMDVVQIGTLDNGLPVYMDALAWNADGVFVINRVKPHTSFSGPNESGIVKMLTIGLGKQKGADAAHRLGNLHFATIMPAMTRMIIEKKKGLLGALAVVENALDKTCLVEAVPAAKIAERDAELLLYARSRMPSLPLKQIDLLIIDRVGKNISGAGMDPNITGRHGSTAKTGGPDVSRLVVLGLTPESKGTATGIGVADIIPRSLADGINYAYSYANVITSTNLVYMRQPMTLDTDEEVLRCGVKTCGAQTGSLRAIRIRDTLTLDRMYVSKAAADALCGAPSCRVAERAVSFAFNARGELDTDDWNWPRSV